MHYDQLKYFALSLSIVLIAGCAIKAPRDQLGYEDKIPTEEFANATAFIAPLPAKYSKVFQISTPPGVLHLGCKSFRNLDGNRIRICRKAARAYINGKQVSTFPYKGKWFIFAPEKPRHVAIVSANGMRHSVKLGNEVRQANKTSVYTALHRTFPYLSGEIARTGGSRLLFGEETLLALTVPSLGDWKEKAAICGLGSVSSTMVYGIASVNPIAIIPAGIRKVIQGYCAYHKKPRLLNGATTIADSNPAGASK